MLWVPLTGACILLLLILYFITHFETTLYSLKADRLQQLQFSEDNRERWLAGLMTNRKTVEIFFIISRAFLTVLFVFIFDRLFTEIGTFPDLVLRYVIEGAILWLLLIVVFQLMPMHFAMRRQKLGAFTLVFGRVLYYIFYPLTIIWRFLLRPFIKTNGIKSLESLAFERELASIIPGEDSIDELEAEEKRMIQHIFDIGNTLVREIMSPRIDMVCIKDSASFEDALQIIAEAGHSRLPVYRERIDNIIGILYAKDLLIAYQNKEKISSLLEISRKPYFVPEAKPVSDLLAEFRRRKNHMAIVVDEYGGVAGLITMEDILEEIVGEIQDEYDVEEEPITELSPNVFIIQAKTTIDEINEEIGLEIPEFGDFDSIGGLVFHHTGEVPKIKDRLELDDYGILIIIEEVTGHRIEKIKLIIKEKKDEENGDKKD